SRRRGESAEGGDELSPRQCRQGIGRAGRCGGCRCTHCSNQHGVLQNSAWLSAPSPATEGSPLAGRAAGEGWGGVNPSSPPQSKSKSVTPSQPPPAAQGEEQKKDRGREPASSRTLCMKNIAQFFVDRPIMAAVLSLLFVITGS